ncbi:hypothetical protein B0G83_101806 [Paraburkholderia sp. BL21I4N1]|nr:hypothetical protein B0G83_101806 [Paraburkholderia sp. BL21I4N1]
MDSRHESSTNRFGGQTKYKNLINAELSAQPKPPHYDDRLPDFAAANFTCHVVRSLVPSFDMPLDNIERRRFVQSRTPF